MDFHGMRRKELQALCKRNGIPANLTNLEMANRLTALIGEKQNPIAQQRRSCLKDTGELVRENDSDGVTKQCKKVRFSPENEMMEFKEFGYERVQAKKGERRKTMTRSIAKKENSVIENFDTVKPSREIVENPVRTTRSRAQKVIDGGVNPVELPTIEKKWTRRGLKSGCMVVKDDDGGEKHYPVGDNSDLASESAAARETRTSTRRSARIRVRRDDSKEVDYVAASGKNPRQRSLKKQGAESTAESSGNNHIAADGEIAQLERRLKRSRRNASKTEDCAVLNLDPGKGEMVGGVSNKCFGSELAGNSSAVGNKVGAEAKAEFLGKLEVVLPLEETSRHPGRVRNKRNSVLPQIDEVEIDVGKVENEKELIHKNPTNIRKKKPQRRRDPILAESVVAEPPRQSTRHASRTDKAILDAETGKVSYRKEVPSRSKLPRAEVDLLAESRLAVNESSSLDAQLHVIDVAEHSIDPSPDIREVLDNITSKKRKEFSNKYVEKQGVSAETSCSEEFKAPEMENSMEIPASTSENSKKRREPIPAESVVAEPPRRSTRHARTDKAVLDAETGKVSDRKEVPSRSKLPSAEVDLLAVNESPSLDVQLPLIDVVEHSIDLSPDIREVLDNITSRKRKEFSSKSPEKQEVSAETSCSEEFKAPEMENSMEIPASTSENSKKRREPIPAESVVAEPPRRSTRHASRTDKAVLDAETGKVSDRKEVPSRSKLPSAEVDLLAVKESPSLDVQLPLIDVVEHSFDLSPDIREVLDNITSKKRKEFSSKSLEKQEVSAETSCSEEFKAPEMENSMEIPASTSENSKNDIVENEALFSASRSEFVDKLNIVMVVDKEQALQDNDSRLNLASNFSKSRDCDSKNLVKPVSEIDSNTSFYASFTYAMSGDDDCSLPGQRGFVGEPSGITDLGQEKKREENSATGTCTGLGSVVAHQEVDGRASVPIDRTLVDLEDGDSLCEKNTPGVDVEGLLANSNEIIGLKGTSEPIHEEAGEISVVNVSNSGRITPREIQEKHKCESDKLPVGAAGQESSNCMLSMLNIEVETHLNENFSAFKDQPDVDAGLSELELEGADAASCLVSSSCKEISEDTNAEEKMGGNDSSLKKHHSAEDCTKSSDSGESLESTRVSSSGKLQGDFGEQDREIPDGEPFVVMEKDDKLLVASNQKLYKDGMHNGNEYDLFSWSQNKNGGSDTKTVFNLEPIYDLCKVCDVGISKSTSEIEGQSSVQQGGFDVQSTSQLVLSKDFKMQTPVSSKHAGWKHVSSPNYAAEDDKSSVLEVQNLVEGNEACRFAEPNVDERDSETKTEPNGQLLMDKEKEGIETKLLSNSKEIMEKGASAFIDRNKMSLISMRDTDHSEETRARIFPSKLPHLFDNEMISSLEHTPLKDVNESGQGDEFRTLFATPLDNVNTNQQEGCGSHKTEMDIANKLKGSTVNNFKNGNLNIGEVQEVDGLTENENTCNSEEVLDIGAGKSATAGTRMSLISSMRDAESSLAVCNDLMSSFEHTSLKDEDRSRQGGELRMPFASLAENVNPNKEEACSQETKMDDIRTQGSSDISNKKNGCLNIGEKQELDKLTGSANSFRSSENIMEKRKSKAITDGRKMSLISSNWDAYNIEDTSMCNVTSESPLLVHNDVIHSFKQTPTKDDKQSRQGDELKTLFATPTSNLNSNEEEGCSLETGTGDVRKQEVSNISNLVNERLIIEEPQKLLELKNNENETTTYNENASAPAIKEVTDDTNLEQEFSGTYKESDGLGFQVNAPKKVPNEKLLEPSVEAGDPPIMTEEGDIVKSGHSEETIEGNVTSDFHAVVIDSEFQGSEAAAYHTSHCASDHKASGTNDKAISSSEVRLSVDNETQEKGNTSSPHDFGSSLSPLSTVADAKEDDESFEGDPHLKCSEIAPDEERAGQLPEVGFGDPGKCKDLDAQLSGKSDTGLADALCKESSLSKEKIMGVLVGGTSNCTEGTKMLEQEQNQGSLAPIFEPANSGHLHKTAIRNSHPCTSDMLVDKDANESATLATESHSNNVTDHRIEMAQELDKVALRTSHEFLPVDHENCKDIGETAVDAAATKLQIGEIKFDNHVSYRIGILEGNSNIKDTSSGMKDASPGDYDNCLEHEKVVETSSLLNILDCDGQIYESLPCEGGLGCNEEGRELTEAERFNDIGPTVSSPVTLSCNEDRDESTIRRNAISSAKLSKEQVGGNKVATGDGISYLESNKCLCGNDAKSTTGDTNEVPCPLHNLNGTMASAGVSNEQAEKQNFRTTDYESSELSLESDMFNHLEINMFKFERSFSENVMDENTDAILTGKEFANHNHLMEVKVLGQNDSLVSVDSFFPDEKVSEKIEVSEVISITKSREHATLEGENTANSVVEATELREAASDTDSTSKNQMPEFTDSAADYGVAACQVLTTLQRSSKMTELESPAPKAWEGDAATGQLKPTTLQRSDARTSLVQATPVKTIAPDMKENVPSIKRHPLGSTTVKSTAKRLALGDLRNK